MYHAGVHERSYKVLDREGSAPRTIQVHAQEAEITQLVDEGFVVRERILSEDLLATLRAEVDRIEEAHLRTQRPSEDTSFGGLFIRNVIAESALLRDFCLGFEPLVSVARAVLGPQVQLHASVLRVAYPELANQGVEWHFHQRVVPTPAPPFFLRPTVIDNLIYLDDLTDDSGPLVVLPRTHKIDEQLLGGDHSDKAGQVKVTCPAGSCVTSHSSLWHKALAPAANSKKRRLLIVGYSPVWLKQIDVPGPAVLESIGVAAPSETRELLGLEGFY